MVNIVVWSTSQFHIIVTVLAANHLEGIHTEIEGANAVARGTGGHDTRDGQDGAVALPNCSLKNIVAVPMAVDLGIVRKACTACQVTAMTNRIESEEEEEEEREEERGKRKEEGGGRKEEEDPWYH